MKLTLYFDYSLRVLIYLARNPDKTVTISEIADYFNISRNHLIKVVHQLGIRGFILTTRGKRGGMKLARTPSQIGIGDVTRKMEPDFNLLECFDASATQCVLSAECTVKSIFFDACRAFLSRLDQYTLDDVLRGSAQRRKLRFAPDGAIRILPAETPSQSTHG